MLEKSLEKTGSQQEVECEMESEFEGNWLIKLGWIRNEDGNGVIIKGGIKIRREIRKLIWKGLRSGNEAKVKNDIGMILEIRGQDGIQHVCMKS